MTFFIDSDAFIGLLSDEDALHDRVLSLTNMLIKKEKNALLFTSWDVVDEVVTKLSYRLSKRYVELFFGVLDKYKVHTFFATQEDGFQAKALLMNIPSKNISMTDCMNMILVKKNGIDAIFSFDAIYKKQGFKTVS
jgi:predicted nucleic acid-binding protein